MQNPFKNWPFGAWPSHGASMPGVEETLNAWRSMGARMPGAEDPLAGMQRLFSGLWEAGSGVKSGASEWQEAGERLTASLQEQWQSWVDQLGRTMEGLEGFGSIWGVQRGIDERVAPLGASREYVRQLQDHAAAQAELLPALKAFQQVMAAFPEGLQKQLARHAAERRQADKPLTSLRELIDFWIDAGEDAFAEIAHSEAFGSALGRITNVLSKLKIQRQRMLDQQLEVLGLPTRAELRSSHERLQQARRDIRALRREMAELQQTVARLRPAATSAAPEAAAADAGSAEPAARKQPARKQSTAGKSTSQRPARKTTAKRTTRKAD